MATLPELEDALRNADAAGDTAAAQQLANEIVRMRAVPQRSTAQTISRGLGYLGAGFNREAAGAIGALPDLLNRGFHAALGQPNPGPVFTNALNQGIDYLGLGEPQTQQTLSGLVTGNQPSNAPQSTFERAMYGAGQGIAQAGEFLLPATAATRLPGVAGRVATTLAAQPATQVAAGAVGGAAQGATNNPWIGLAAALATPLALRAPGKMISPITSQLTPEQQRLAGVAAQEGIPLTVGQQTGSKPIQMAESALAWLPGSAGAAQREQQAQRVAFNRAVLARAGISADRATPQVVNAAYDQLGRRFNSLAARTTVQYDNQFAQDLLDATTTYNRKLPSQQRQIFHNYINDLLNSAPALPGTVYQTARSDLTRTYRSLRNSDPVLSDALHQIRDALDSAATRSVPPAMADEWATVRREYSALETISNAMQSGAAGAAAGEIPPARLYSTVRQGVGARQMARGSGQLNDLARVGQTFLKPLPESGTAPRNAAIRLLTLGALGGGVPGGAALAAGASHPIVAAATLLGLGSPAVIQRLMQSPEGRAWLTNQIAVNLGPRTNAGLLTAIAGARGIGGSSMFNNPTQ